MEEAMMQAPARRPGASPPHMPKLIMPRLAAMILADSRFGSGRRNTERMDRLARMRASNCRPTMARMSELGGAERHNDASFPPSAKRSAQRQAGSQSDQILPSR